MKKEFDLNDKRKELILNIKTTDNPLLIFGLNIMKKVEEQDEEFIKIIDDLMDVDDVEFRHGELKKLSGRGK